MLRMQMQPLSTTGLRYFVGIRGPAVEQPRERAARRHLPEGSARVGEDAQRVAGVERVRLVDQGWAEDMLGRREKVVVERGDRPGARMITVSSPPSALAGSTTVHGQRRSRINAISAPPVEPVAVG